VVSEAADQYRSLNDPLSEFWASGLACYPPNMAFRRRRRVVAAQSDVDAEDPADGPTTPTPLDEVWSKRRKWGRLRRGLHMIVEALVKGWLEYWQ
jgi:hypothetical protein